MVCRMDERVTDFRIARATRRAIAHLIPDLRRMRDAFHDAVAVPVHSWIIEKAALWNCSTT